MKRLYVAFAIDEAYAPHAAVAIASLMQTNRDHQISVLVLHAGLAEATQAKLRELLSAHARADIRFERADERVRNLPTFAHFPPAIHMRFLVPILLGPEVGRALYLDADTLVRSDLAELWEVDLTGRSVGAVVEFGAPGHQRDRLGLDAQTPYFNNGVLLFDVQQWLARNTTDRIIEFMQQKGRDLLMIDQDAFNLVVGSQIMPLSPRWNAQAPIFFRGHRELELTAREHKALLRDHDILHFTHDPKPWHATDRHPWGYLYRRIRAKTAFRDPTIRRERLEHPVTLIVTTLRRLLLLSSPSVLVGLQAMKRELVRLLRR